MMDNFMTAPGVDTRPEHLAQANIPLAYHVASYQPGVHNAANVHEFFLWLRERMDARGRDDMAITVNFWGIGTPNGLARHIDAFGGEGKSKTGASTNWNPRILDYRRAIAYHKPRSFSNGDNDLTLQDVEEFVDLALFYAVYPNRKDDAHGWEEGSDELVAHAQQVVQQFAASGWEPITHASMDSADVWVERYGGGELEGGVQVDDDIHFAVHNTLTQAISSTLTVDLTPLGITDPTDLTVTELVSDSPASFQVIGEQALIAANLTPLDTLVFRLRQEPPFPYVTIQAVGATDILLDWNHDPAYSGYQIWRENDPYFTPTPPAYAQVSSAPWQFTDHDALGDVEQNYYYLVSGDLVAGGSVFSERLGEFDFALVPGTG
jgi:hypothetical protein